MRMIGLVNGHHISLKDKRTREAKSLVEAYNGSRLFKKAAGYCADMYDDWYILSPVHGLLHWRGEVVTSDRNWMYLSASEREAWCEKVSEQVVMAGLLEDYVMIWWHTVRGMYDMLHHLWPASAQQAPLLGLGQGEQMQFYTDKGY